MARRRRDANYNGLKLIAVTLFIGLLVIWVLSWDHARRVKFAHYEAFGIDLPVLYSIHGIDVSRYQKEIRWNMVKAMNVEGVRIEFAFMKATEGEGLTDRYFKYNWRQAKKQKITRGAYHFFCRGKTQLSRPNILSHV